MGQSSDGPAVHPPGGISSYCNPEDPNARNSEGFQQLKRHIVDLSRENIAEDLEDTAREEDWTLKRQKKENV